MNHLSNASLVAVITLLIGAVASLAEEGMQPQVAIITGEFRDPRSREIGLQYDSAPARTISRIVLDEQNRFSSRCPLHGEPSSSDGTKADSLACGSYSSLWSLTSESCSSSMSNPATVCTSSWKRAFSGLPYSFSGLGADNNRFVVEWMSEFGPLQSRLRGAGTRRFQTPSRSAAARPVRVSGRRTRGIRTHPGICRLCYGIHQVRMGPTHGFPTRGITTAPMDERTKLLCRRTTTSC